jgi:AmmeMemoRadiSam system protein A
MTDEERRELLRLAREAIAAALEGRRYEPAALAPGLTQFAGAFVTLRRHGELRGCIGRVEAREPVADVVAECAVSAALRDPRFSPLTPEEFAAGAEIEISVLTPRQRVASVEEIEVGRDGLVVRQGHKSGLLLPQVAIEWGWDRETFLAQTCRKAGLALDAWKHGAEIARFQAEVFGEGEEPDSPISHKPQN